MSGNQGISPPEPGHGVESATALEAAWRIHQAQSEWTGRVDSKAAFAFTMESAAIATTVALSAKGRLFSHIHVWGWWLPYWIGLALLLVAAYFSALVVIPRLRRGEIDGEAADNFIFFGHARRWDATDLEEALLGRPLLPQLSRQIVRMAEIAWTKHRNVQFSFSLGFAGAILLVLCGLAQTIWK